jgi:hypothetical protein
VAIDEFSEAHVDVCMVDVLRARRHRLPCGSVHFEGAHMADPLGAHNCERSVDNEYVSGCKEEYVTHICCSIRPVTDLHFV